MTLFSELKRRNVLRVAIAYAAFAWLLVQVVETVLPVFGYPDEIIRIIFIVLAIGFLPVLVVAWAFELTPEGLKREKDVDRSQSITPQTGKRLDRLIIVILTLALLVFAVDKFVLDPRRDAAQLEIAREEAASKALAEAEAALPERSIAVLPFADMSPEQDQEYFSDGMAEELLNLLAKIPELRVISRSSAFSFKGKNLDIPTIAEQLKVRHILEGSVRKAGSEVRITAQLIDARTDEHLWSETYDRPMGNIFAVQDEIAGAVVDKMKVTLLGEMPKTAEADPEAYALYLRARHLSRTSSFESQEQAVALYDEALAIDPGYAPAWAGLARTLNNIANAAQENRDEIAARARQAAEKAIAADPDYGYAYSVLAWNVHAFDNDLVEAARLHQKALSRAPNDPAVIGNASVLLQRSPQKFEQAVELHRHVARLDPLSAISQFNLAGILWRAGEYEQSETVARRALVLSPNYTNGYYILGMSLLWQDRPGEALEAFEKNPFPGYRFNGIAMAQHDLGNEAASEQALDEAKAMYKERGAGDYGKVHAYRGEIDLAFQWLEKELEVSGRLSPAFGFDPMLVDLYDDPRWPDLAHRAGIDKDPLAGIDFEVSVPESRDSD